MKMSTTSDVTTLIPHVVQTIRELSFSWYDYVLFSGMLIVSALIGVYFGCFGDKQSTANEYLMGSKKMKVFPISVSLVASHISGITLLAIPADIYRFGAAYWLLVPAALITWSVTVYVFLPVFYKLQIRSTYEYLERRFDRETRMFASFLFAMGLFLYLPVVIYIPALAFSAATGFNVHYITPVVCGVCIFYTTLGGLKAVVWTDTLQFIVTVGAVFTVVVIGIKSGGGFGAIWSTAREGHRLDFFNFDLDPTQRDSFWSIIIGLSVGWIGMASIHQSCVQKYLSLPTLRHAELSVLLFHIGLVLVSSFSVFTGLIMYARYADCDPVLSGAMKKNDQLLPYYIMDVASSIPGLPGLFIAGVFCAALSTLSASLNCLAGTMYDDFISKFMGTVDERRAAVILKLLVVILGVFCTGLVFIVEKLGGIVPLVFSLGGATHGPLVGLFLAGVLLPKVSSKSALYGSIIAMLLTSWVVVMTQYYKARGIIVDVPKPLSTEGCPANYTTLPVFSTIGINETTLEPIFDVDKLKMNLTSNDSRVDEGEKFVPFVLFRISFWYTTPLSTLVTLICILFLNYLFRNDDPPVHRDLISPVIYFLLAKEKAPDDKTKEYYTLDKALHLVSTNSEKEDEQRIKS